MNDAAVDDPTFLALADLFVDIAREMRAKGALVTPVVPLNQTQGQVMRYVHTHPGCSASDIADGSGLQRANVSTALRDLRGRGYITSQRDEDDGRAIRINATELADDTIARLRTSWAAIIAEAWRVEGGDDSAAIPDAVTQTLSRIRAGLGADRAMKAFATTPAAAVSLAADSNTSAAAPSDAARDVDLTRSHR